MAISRKEREDVAKRTAIQVAITAGAASRPFVTGHGRFLATGRGRIPIQKADGTVTPMGRFYYEQLGVPPPELYDYEQPLITTRTGQYVVAKKTNAMTGNRQKIRVRAWRPHLNEGRGGWEITKRGEDYFRFNRDEYIVELPVIKVRATGNQEIGRDYYPIKQSEARPDIPRWTLAARASTEDEREAYLKDGVREWIRRLPDEIVVRPPGNLAAALLGGVASGPFKIVHHDSDWWYVYDPDDPRPWRVHKQRVNFREESPPEIETILNRPLHGATAIPLDCPYPWDLHEKCEESTGACVVDMIHECAQKQTRGRGGTKCVPLFTREECQRLCDETRARLYPDPNEYPFEGEYSGHPAQVAIELAKEQGWVVSVLFGLNKVYHWKPTGVETRHLPHVAFVVRDYHAFFFKKGEDGGGGAIRSIAGMAVKSPDSGAPARKIDVAEEESKTPVFEKWAEFCPYKFAEECLAARAKGRGREQRQLTTEFLYTFDMGATLEALRHDAEPEPTDFLKNGEPRCEEARFIREVLEDEEKAAEVEARWLAEGGPAKDKADRERRREELAPDVARRNQDLLPVRLRIHKAHARNDPEKVQRIYVKYLLRIDVCIVEVPEDVHQLAWMCREAGVPYRGEGLVTVALNIFRASLRSPRGRVTPEMRRTLLSRQNGECACGGRLEDGAWEVDHVTPLVAGGADALDNMCGRCAICHLERTEQQRLMGLSRRITAESTLSTDLLELFQMAPKPPQITYGDGVVEGTPGLDVRSCRRKVLEENQYPLPVFSLLDAWEEWDRETEYDFYYVDDGPVPQAELKDRLPYTGPGVYWKFAWREEGFPREATQKALVASQHAPRDVFKTPFAAIERCAREAYILEEDAVIAGHVKKAVLALIGLFGKPFSYVWKVTESLAEDDRLGALFKTQKLPDGRLKLYSRTETLTNVSMLPSHLIALSGEHVHLGRAARAINLSPGLRVLGMQVDCVYYGPTKKRRADAGSADKTAPPPSVPMYVPSETPELVRRYNQKTGKDELVECYERRNPEWEAWVKLKRAWDTEEQERAERARAHERSVELSLELALEEVVRTMKHPYSGELVYRKTKAKAGLNCRQGERVVAPRESHWRAPSPPFARSGPNEFTDPRSLTEAEAEWEGDVGFLKTASFGAWVLAPTLRRVWREVREDASLASALDGVSLGAAACGATSLSKDGNEEVGGRFATILRCMDAWDEQERGERLARDCYRNGGALVVGEVPGTGKTVFIQKFKAVLKEAGEEYYVGSVTHVAAAIAEGRTLTHCRLSLRNKKRVWLIIDEGSFNSAHEWGWLARFQFVGCKFLVVGDFAGQLLSVSSQYDGFDYEKIERSDFMHGLVNGLRVVLTTYRRGRDLAHRDFVKTLYDRTDAELPLCVAAAKAQYPPPLAPHYHLVMSHRTRMRVNAEMNGRLAPEDAVQLTAPVVRRGSMSNLPQDMRVWPGLKLLGCVKQSDEKTTNGLEYQVLAVDDRTVTLRRLHPSGDTEKHGDPFTLTHREAALQLRLQHALCYYSAQGRTLRDGPVTMMDTGHRHFTRRHLIVGLSRVGEGRDVGIAR